jgi:hypothetical protein
MWFALIQHIVNIRLKIFMKHYIKFISNCYLFITFTHFIILSAHYFVLQSGFWLNVFSTLLRIS